LTAKGAKGSGKFPYVTALPYFTTVPFNPVAFNCISADSLDTCCLNAGLQLMVINNLLNLQKRKKNY
jgi:hypothetical protein